MELSPQSDEFFPELLQAVEQQLISPQTSYVASTLKRLILIGLSETEAKFQIATCLAEQMQQVFRSKRPFDEKSYKADLADLPLAPDEDESEDES